MTLKEINFQHKKRLYWLFQIAGWSIYYFSSGVIYALNHGVNTKLFVNLLFNIAIMIAVTHLFRAAAIYLKWFNFSVLKLLSIFCVLSLLTSVPLAFFNFYLDRWSFTPTETGPIDNQGLYDYSMHIFKNLVPWVAFYGLFIYLERLHKSHAHELELKSELYEAKIGYYKNQLNPHFLFNALNCVRTLIETKSDLAVDVTNRLSIFLRNTIDKSTHDLISLREELDLVQDYLFIEKVRFGERLNFKIEVTGDIRQGRIPPMVIQTLAENAVKHGIGKSRMGGDVFISVFEGISNYRVEVLNTGHYYPMNGSGVGLKNCIQRLNLTYQKEGLLEIGNFSDNSVRAQLSIPK